MHRERFEKVNGYAMNSICSSHAPSARAVFPRAYRALGASAPIVSVFLAIALTLLLAACGGSSSSAPSNPNTPPPSSPTVSSVAVTPANPSVTAGATEQFKAVATYSDNSTKDVTSSASWVSASTSVATINSAGLATSVNPGATKITAGLDSVSGSTTLTVAPVPAGIVSIAVTPPAAVIVITAPVQFTAVGSYANGSTQNLTDSVTWSSSNTAAATVSSTGLVTGVAAGTSTITASYTNPASGSTPASTVTGSASATVQVSSGLPTGIGWHALPSNTELDASGACPPNNFGGDPFLFTEYCANVIRAWSGAIADTDADQLLIFGGGHNNYYGNEIYSLNLAVDPVTLTRLKDPTVPTNFANQSNCIEAIPPGVGTAPNSRESYGGLAFIPSAYRMYVLDGSLACLEGDGSTGTWTISLSSLSNSSNWVNENLTMTGANPATEPGGDAYGNIADYDPNSGLVFISDASSIFTYDYSTNTTNQITPSQGFVTSIYLSGAVDPSRKLFVVLGGCSTNGTCQPGDGVFVADISNPTTTTQQDWTANTMAQPTCAEFLEGGVNPILSANPGIAFDSVADDFVAWPNQGNSVYILTPDPTNQRLTCTKDTFAGGPPNSSQNNAGANSSNGTFGRFRYFPTPDAFVLINDWNIPAYILRLR
jgi:Bacterial Ig-like domain (group 2)